MINTSALIQSAILPKEELDSLTSRLCQLIYNCEKNVSTFSVLKELTSDNVIKNHLNINETLFDEAFLNNDDFLKTVSFTLEKSLGINPSYAYYKAGSILVDKALMIDEKSYLKAQLYTLQSSVNLPCLFFEDNSAMLLSPFEILEGRKLIPHLKGNILVDGVRLGHFLYHASKEVGIDSITVVESDLCLAHFFKQFILPQFGEYGVKINLVQDDFYKFAEREQLSSEYNHVVLLNHDNSVKGIEKHLLIEQLLFHKKEAIPVHFFYHHELYGFVQQFTYFISCLFLENKSRDDVLSIGKHRLNPYLFVYYEYICDLIYSNRPSIISVSDINALVAQGMDVKNLFSIKHNLK